MNKLLIISMALIATAPINLALFFLSGIVSRIGDWSLPLGLIPSICGVIVMFRFCLPKRNTLPIKSNEDLK